MPDQADVPFCPVTGRPAVRHIQWVSATLLRDLWRIEFKTDARASFGGIDRFGLWESPTGLYFFDPPLEGDGAFYTQFYARIETLGLFSRTTVRREFTMASQSIPAGARLLDVGCGLGNFRSCVPHAIYTGVDPHMAKDSESTKIRSETLRQHLVTHAGSYDAVCAFQVLEHVKMPASLFAEMVQAAKPGGQLFVGVPHVPSAMTRIPNFVMNAPPHHLTWWTKSALAELAKRAGAIVENIEIVPWSAFDSLIYWIERCTPLKCNREHYIGRWNWHASAALGLIGGMIANRLAGVPSRDGEGAGLLLTAHRASDAC
jgi:SAM-dependent methyltransferase